MLELIKGMLTGQNAFASGGLLLMIIGGLSVYLRAVPETIWYWVVQQTTMMITVADDDAAFVWVKEWFLEQKFLKRIRHLDLDTTVRNERIALIPAPGKHWFWYEGRPFEVWFSRTESTYERTARRVESLTFRTIGRNRHCGGLWTILSHARRAFSRICISTTTDGSTLRATRRVYWTRSSCSQARRSTWLKT
jgi:chaperone BCS1